MKPIESLNSGDIVNMKLFGKEETLEVFSAGDNQFDENGDYKEEGFALNAEELACLNWFLEQVDIEDYRQEITQYCNEQYDAIGGDPIEEADLESEISIYAIVINVSEIGSVK